jgi:hypothetical protein
MMDLDNYISELKTELIEARISLTLIKKDGGDLRKMIGENVPDGCEEKGVMLRMAERIERGSR